MRNNRKNRNNYSNNGGFLGEVKFGDVKRVQDFLLKNPSKIEEKDEVFFLLCYNLL